jgi:threonine 3-dehydrogenase
MAKTMKALRKTRREPGLELCETEVPSVAANEVLVKVEATAICGSDVHFYRWDEWAATRISPPLTLGHELAGEIVEVGSACSRLKVGDYIAAESHVYCGTCPVCLANAPHVCQNLKILGNMTEGSFAEYIAMPEVCGWVLDRSVSPEVGAIMEPLGGGVHAVLAEPVTGKSVAVFGDGPIALFAVGVAKAAGARMVYFVGKHDFRISIAERMGADVLFSIKDPDVDVVAAMKDATNGAGFDVVLEMSGSPLALEQALGSVRHGGRVSMFGLSATPPVVDLNYGVTLPSVRMLGIAGRLIWDTWIQMDGLLSGGTLDPTPVITHRLGMSEFSKGFEELVSSERRVGKVILYPDR